MPLDVKFKLVETHGEAGQRLRVLALAPSGRILASVELLASLAPGYSLERKAGAALRERLIADAKAIAERLAEVVEAPLPVDGLP